MNSVTSHRLHLTLPPSQEEHLTITGEQNTTNRIFEHWPESEALPVPKIKTEDIRRTREVAPQRHLSLPQASTAWQKEVSWSLPFLQREKGTMVDSELPRHRR